MLHLSRNMPVCLDNSRQFQMSLFFSRNKSTCKGPREGEKTRRLGDLVFKMAESAMADDYAMFQSEFRPLHLAYLEQKIACPDPLCKEKPLFCQKNGLRHHCRRRHPEVRFLPKIEEAAIVRMKKLHYRETRNLLEKLFENRLRKVGFTYL